MMYGSMKTFSGVALHTLNTEAPDLSSPNATGILRVGDDLFRYSVV